MPGRVKLNANYETIFYVLEKQWSYSEFVVAKVKQKINGYNSMILDL